MNTLSLFAGCGGMDIGAEWAGANVIWANEHNEYACETYRNYFKKTNLVEKSIEDLNLGKELPNSKEVELVLGGFPCQDFSIIWKRPGIHGSRGNLYTYFVEIIRKTKPKAFIAENVKGLVSVNNKQAILQIKNDFEDCGYNLHTKVYNFAEYGVPQMRERVLIVGIHKDINSLFIPPLPTHAPIDKALEKGLKPFVSSKKALYGVEDVLFNNEHQNIAQKTRDRLKLIPPGGNFTDIPKEHPLYVKGMISHVYRRLHPDYPSKTIIAGGGGGTWGYHYDEPRSLTNRERARLFGFPDDMEFFGSFTEIRRQIGNAVPPIGIKPFIKKLITLINS